MSLDVDTETVSVADGVDGLITPSNSTLTWSPGAIDVPLNSVQVATSPLLPQLPTAVLLFVTSTTDVFPRALVMSVPDGNVTVMLSLLARESAPVAEVVKLTKYTVRAPTAAEGDVLPTATLLTELACATPANAAISSRTEIVVRTASRTRLWTPIARWPSVRACARMFTAPRTCVATPS